MAEAGATISGVEKTGEIILKGLVYFAQKDQNGAVIASIACNARAMLQKWEGIAILEQYDHLRFNDETDEWRLLHIYAPAIRSEAFAINKILSKYDPRDNDPVLKRMIKGTAKTSLKLMHAIANTRKHSQLETHSTPVRTDSRTLHTQPSTTTSTSSSRLPRPKSSYTSPTTAKSQNVPIPANSKVTSKSGATSSDQTSDSLAISETLAGFGLLTSVESVETTSLFHTIVFKKDDEPQLARLLKELNRKVLELEGKLNSFKLKLSQRANAPGQWLKSSDDYQKDRETGKLLKRFHQRLLDMQSSLGDKAYMWSFHLHGDFQKAARDLQHAVGLTRKQRYTYELYKSAPIELPQVSRLAIQDGTSQSTSRDASTNTTDNTFTNTATKLFVESLLTDEAPHDPAAELLSVGKPAPSYASEIFTWGFICHRPSANSEENQYNSYYLHEDTRDGIWSRVPETLLDLIQHQQWKSVTELSRVQIAYKLVLGYVQVGDVIYHLRYWPSLADIKYHTCKERPQSFFAKQNPLEQEMCWYFNIGQRTSRRTELPADILVKLFGLMFYMICTGKQIVYTSDEGVGWDQNDFETAPHPRTFVKIIKRCLEYRSGTDAEEVVQEAAREQLQEAAQGLAYLVNELKRMPTL